MKTRPLTIEERNKVRSARVLILRTTPYFAAIAMRMPVVVCEDMQAPAAVDKFGRVYLSPEGIGFTLKQIAGVLVHELYHILFRFFDRLGERDPKLFNVAHDIVINEDLKQVGYSLPEGCLFRSTFPGLPDYAQSPEEIYDWLEQQGKGGGGSGGCGTGEIEGEGIGQGAEDDDGASGLGAAQVDELCREVAAATSDAANRNPGSVPRGASMWADELTGPPRVNWRAQLRTFIARAVNTFKRGRQDSDWKSISRRSGAIGVRLPGRVEPVPRLAVVLDTSGSMYADGAVVLSEALGIVGANGAAVDMVTCDAAASAVRAVRGISDLKPILNGGGGTDLQPAIDALHPVRRYAAIFVFTDGYLNEVRVPAGTAVVWCITATGTVPDWVTGRVIRLPA